MGVMLSSPPSDVHSLEIRCNSGKTLKPSLEVEKPNLLIVIFEASLLMQ